jgi:hypothetical protein
MNDLPVKITGCKGLLKVLTKIHYWDVILKM